MDRVRKVYPPKNTHTASSSIGKQKKTSNNPQTLTRQAKPHISPFKKTAPWARVANNS